MSHNSGCLEKATIKIQGSSESYTGGSIQVNLISCILLSELTSSYLTPSVGCIIGCIYFFKDK